MSLSAYMSQGSARPTQQQRPPGTTTAPAEPVSVPPLPPRVATACCLASLCLFVGSLLLLVLLPLSFVSLDYYELGLLKSRTRGVVDSSQVYGPGGKWLKQPDATFQKYQADAHVFTTDPPLSVVTQDRLEVQLGVSFLYFIIPDQLPALQRDYNLAYQPSVESNAVSAVKNAAVRFSTKEYFTNRTVVQKAMQDALKDLQPRLYVRFPHFYITGMRISEAVAAKQLQTANQNEVNAKQLFINTAAEVRRVTDALVNSLQNNATRIKQTAAAAADVAVRVAQAEATTIVATARVAAAAKVFRALNLTTAEQRRQVDWMFGMARRSDLRVRLGYTPQLVQATSNNPGA